MKHLLISTMLLAGSMTVYGETWNLDQCINYAIDHNISIKSRKNDVASSRQSVTDAKSRYLPTLSASAGQSWNIGRGLTAENTYADRNTSNFQWGASFNLPVFSGLSTTRQVAYAKANLAAVTEQYEAAKEDISLNVITAYLQVLYCKELNEVAVNQVSLSEYELTRREALLEAGKIPEIDMLEAKSQLAQDELNVTQTSNDIRLALVDLAQLLELDDIDGFDVMPLDDGSTLVSLTPDDIYNAALQHNHSILAARNGIIASEKNVSLAKTGYIPTINFNAGLGSSYYKISGFANDTFGKQMKNNYSTYFGFSLNIPIFDALNTRNSVNRAKVQNLSARLQYDDACQRLFKSIQQAYYQADGAKHKLEASKVAEEAANKAFDAMREKYNLGRATPSEYEQSKTKALRSTAERIQAGYELILRTRLLEFYATPH